MVGPRKRMHLTGAEKCSKREAERQEESTCSSNEEFCSRGIEICGYFFPSILIYRTV